MHSVKSFMLVVAVSAVVNSTASYADYLAASTFRQWGEETLSQIEDDYALWYGLYSYSADTSWSDYAWGQGVMSHALVAAAKIDSAYLARARKQADEFYQRYWCSQDGTSGYNAGSGACGDRYYDDNAWIALALLELYELTGDSKYLTWAKNTVAFCMTGENGPGDMPDGGIRWHESDAGGASVCSTAPTILANLTIYQTTGIESYKTDGLRLYNWIMNSDLRYESGIFHETNQGPLGYQTAVMTQTAVRLYQITGDQSYLSEAQKMAAAMGNIFIDRSTGALTQHGKWGGHDMTNAYVELYEVDGNHRWLDLAAGYLEFLYVNCIDGETGFYPETWHDTSGNYSIKLIDNASVARAFWKMAGTPGGTTRYDYFAEKLCGRWMFDENSGTIASDSSGFGNDGTLSGSSFSFDNDAVSGHYNGGLDFDGYDDYVDLPNGFANFKNGMTVSVWAYPTAVNDWARFLDMGNGEYDNNIVFGRHGGSNNLFFQAYDGTSSGGEVIATGAIELYKWQMFTASLDSSGVATLYKDGVPVATGSTALPSNIERINNYIGRSNWAQDAYFKGRMDDVRIYNYALSQQEIQSLYLYGGQAANPSPADNAENVWEVVKLSWVPGSLSGDHDVYLGTDQAEVANATFTSPEYKGRQSQAAYDTSLKANTTYYWRVDNVTAQGISEGAVWEFTTAAMPTQDLLAYYPMEYAHISGGNAIDTSGTDPQMNGTVVGGASDASGQVAGAADFDGYNDYIDLPDGFADFTDGMTVSLWAYPTSTGFWARFMDFGNGANNNNIVFARDASTTSLVFEVHNGSVSGGRVSASGAIALNQWQMFTATLDPSGYVKLFKNGLEVAGGQASVPAVVTRTRNYIGKSNWSDPYYQGRMDDFAIWNRALTDAEIAALYNRGQAHRSFLEKLHAQELVTHLQFNDGFGNIAIDASGNGYDSQLLNMGVANWTSGKQCSGLYFDGIDDSVQITGYKGVAGGASRTCTAWIKTSHAGGEIFAWGNTNVGQKWVIRVNEGGELRAEVQGGYIVGTKALDDNEWHHVAVVLDSDSSPDISEAQLFVDGQPDAVSGVLEQSVNTATQPDVTVGYFPLHPYRYFEGLIDEVRIYDRAISAEQILQMYNEHVLIADYEHDGDVDLNDFAVLGGFWQETENCEVDLTCDCVVDFDDLMILTDEWLQSY